MGKPSISISSSSSSTSSDTDNDTISTTTTTSLTMSDTDDTSTTLSTISSVTLSDTDSSSLTLSDNDPMDPDNVGNNVEINIDRKNGKIIAKSINPHSSSDDRCLNTDYLTSSVSSTDDEIHITDDYG